MTAAPDRELYLLALALPLVTAILITLLLHHFLLPAKSRSFQVIGIVGAYFIGPAIGLGIGSRARWSGISQQH